MRLSHLFTTTTRQAPADAELASHKLLVRAGYVKQQSAGVFSILPLGLRCMQKIERIIRQEMDRIGGQEILMPVVINADLWRETGRWDDVKEELLRFKDRNGKDMVLGMTHEEVVTDIARRYIKSYRQLPAMIYQIQTKYRDEARPRGGLIRLREFTMKDAYSFHGSSEELDRYYDLVYRAYERIYRRCGLPVVVVQSDPGMMGGKVAHEFMTVTPGGEDTLVLCRDCDYAANREVARAAREQDEREPRALELVATPGCVTVAEVTACLDVTPDRLAKAVAYRDDTGTLYLVLIRGDLEVNGIKLQNHLGREVDYAGDADIEARGLVPGYMSPVGASPRPDLRVLVDESVAVGRNMVCGGNREGHHYVNANFGRDFEGEVVDVAGVVDGERCRACGGTLQTVRAVEVGNIFKLGTKYAEAMGAAFTDEDGRSRPMIMGCYGIGIGRILAALVERFSDKHGMSLPITVAPYDVHLVALDWDTDDEVRHRATALYHELQDMGREVLLDDRRESAGVKFKDADLIGIPIRVTISPRTLSQEAVEIKLRRAEEMRHVPLAGAAREVARIRDGFLQELTP